MTRLTKADLQELDNRIDQALGLETLLALPKDIALINLLRFFEDYCRLFALGRADFADGAALLKFGQDGMQFAMKWIHTYCEAPTRNDKFNLDFDLYAGAGQLHERAIRYSIVWDLMAQLYRGAATGERVNDDLIHLTYADPEAEVFDTCSHFLASPDAPNFQKALEGVLEKLAPEKLIQSITIRRHASGRIKYSVPEEVFQEIADAQRSVLTSRWELGATWSVGDYTLAEFREFWVALLSISWIHNVVCFHSGVKGGALESVVRAMSWHGWQSEISQRSQLSKEAVAAILNDLTYDPKLYASGKKEPDVTYQPFFGLRGEFLALSNQLVMLSNPERNLWDLLSIIRPELHSRLRNRKEALWLAELRPKLQANGLRSFGPIKIVFEDKTSDLDLLVIDDAQRFGLGLQLKWLNHPDRIRDVKYIDTELLKGLDQAEFAAHWLHSGSQRVIELIGKSCEEVKRYEFQTAVFSKNTFGSTSTIRNRYPVLTERLFDWILREPHQRGLRTLWRVGEERRYMPKRGDHFTDEEVSAEFGGIKLIGKKMGLRKLRSWDPVTDIDFTGLVEGAHI